MQALFWGDYFMLTFTMTYRMPALGLVEWARTSRTPRGAEDEAVLSPSRPVLSASPAPPTYVNDTLG